MMNMDRKISRTAEADTNMVKTTKKQLSAALKPTDEKAAALMAMNDVAVPQPMPVAIETYPY